MNIIVDMYCDKNIGDDLMSETLIRTLLDTGSKCYLIVNDLFLAPDFISDLNNVTVINNIDADLLKEKKIDSYIKIGGSIFPHGTLMEGIKRYKTLKTIKLLKKNGVGVCILGCSIGPMKVNFGVNATKKIIKIADLITCRDKPSYNFIKAVNPKNSYLFPDIVLSRKDLKTNEAGERKDIGISVYTGYAPYLRKYNAAYSDMIVDLVNKYSAKYPDSTVKLLLFDTGYNTDFPVANYIFNKVQQKNVRIVPYGSNCSDFIEEFSSCKFIIGARFHAIILAILLKIPVLPVIYSNKTKNLLADVKYNGTTIEIDNCANIDTNYIIQQIENGNLLSNVDDSYLSDSEGHMEQIKRFISSRKA
jgi:colanic acid/amylovoran biosynthesis protein